MRPTNGVDPDHPSGARARVTLLDTADMYGRGPTRSSSDARFATGATRRSSRRSSASSARRPRRARHRRATRLRPPVMRREPTTARDRRDRPVPVPSRRSDDSDRGDRRRDGRARRGREGALHRPLRGAAVRHPARCSGHPIASLQSEYSLFERNLEDGVLDLCEELGIGLLAYSPLGRGMLTGKLRSADDLLADDARHEWPRFQGDNLERNLELVERVEAFAADKQCTAGQIALAWLLGAGRDRPDPRNEARRLPRGERRGNGGHTVSRGAGPPRRGRSA